MLTQTFCHIPRMTLAKERALWEKGIHSWESCHGHAKDGGFLAASRLHLERSDPSFFARTLKSDQHWRLFREFRAQAAYLDIETTGLSKQHDHITSIALYDGETVRTYVHGRNLEQFKHDVSSYKLLVTFNGKCFDAPFIKATLGVDLPEAHIDLRYVMKRLGYAGGLKNVERALGIDRGALRDVDGFFAVRLWNEYRRRGCERALETLLAYNCADVLNLERLMLHAYNQNLRQTPFAAQLELEAPPAPVSPHKADPEVLERLSPAKPW